MPISDTWPGGPGLETMMGMDSAGSCDSVASANSACSDDSLDHLSAEEKACLLFLEETIESLDTEEDSDVSNDDTDLPPNPGAVGSQQLDPSAPMNKGSENLSSKDPMKENVHTKLPQTHLVPTPFVLAGSIPRARANVSATQNSNSEPQIAAPSKEPEVKPRQIRPVQVPVDANIIKPPPPPIKPREFSVKAGEAPLPRGPLSYDALFHLRKCASEKMTPLCPKIDHTIDLEKHLPAPLEAQKQESDRSNQQPRLPSKVAPPALLPKPKKIPAEVSLKTPDQAPGSSDPSYKLKPCSDAQAVRLEALHKLGLLQEREPPNQEREPEPEPEPEMVPPPPPPKPKKFLNPTSDKQRVPSDESPSICEPQVVTEPKTRLLLSSRSFSQSSRAEQQTAAASHHAQPSSRVKPAGEEPSATPDNRKAPVPFPKPRHVPAPNPIQARPAAQAPPDATPGAVGYTVMVVPSMGADRKEALRKLGLLKT